MGAFTFTGGLKEGIITIKLGIHAGAQNCTYEDLQRVWHLADSSGVYWVSVWDHLLGTSEASAPHFEGLSMMAALAAETTNVRVGCLVFAMGFRHPAVLAKGAVTIDHVSNGRLELGIGAGAMEPEHTAYGLPFPPLGDRMDVFEEGVQIIKSMLTQESTTFDGKHFHLKDVHSFPRPVQKRPRVWVGGHGERRTLRIAARHGDGWNGAFMSPEVYQHKAQVLDRWCQVEHRDPETISRSVNVGFYMGADQSDAENERQRYLDRWGAQAGELEGGMLLGTTAQTIDRIGAYVDVGAQGLNINVNAPFNFEALQAFAEEVVPAFA